MAAEEEEEGDNFIRNGVHADSSSFDDNEHEREREREIERAIEETTHKTEKVFGRGAERTTSPGEPSGWHDMARQATTRPTFGSNSQVPVSFGGENLAIFSTKKLGKLCWARPRQGQALSHSIQLLQVLPY
jgi:hypothetical protein